MECALLTFTLMEKLREVMGGNTVFFFLAVPPKSVFMDIYNVYLSNFFSQKKSKSTARLRIMIRASIDLVIARALY